MDRNKIIGLVAVVLVLGGAGALAYRGSLLNRPGQPEEPVLQTSTVRRGNLILTAYGAGTLVPATEVELGFRTGGYVADVLAEVGDQVQEGDILLKQDTEPLEQAVANAEVQVRLSQLDLADVRSGPDNAEMAAASAAVRDSQTKLEIAQRTFTQTLNTDFDAQVRARQIEFDWYVGQYQKAKSKFERGKIEQDTHDHAMNAMISAEGRLNKAIENAKIEELQSQSQLDQAESNLYQAYEDLRELQSGPITETLLRAELEVDQALLSLEDARADLEAAQIRAPFAATVMDVAAQVGEYVGDNPCITLAELRAPLVQFWVEETDLPSAVVGYPVNLYFEALPDVTFTGEIVRVAPALTTVDGVPAVEAWASVDLSSYDLALPSGLSAEVEIVAGQALNALLVPVEALRELSPGQFAVFVVKPDGQMELRPVEVGIQDYVSAEILSGLEAGEVVSTGETETD